MADKLKGIKKTDKDTMSKYKEDIYDKLETENIEEMVDLFIQKVRKEME